MKSFIGLLVTIFVTAMLVNWACAWVALKYGFYNIAFVAVMLILSIVISFKIGYTWAVNRYK